MKTVFKVLAVFTMVFGLTTSAFADGGERGILPIDKPIVKPMDGGERG